MAKKLLLQQYIALDEYFDLNDIYSSDEDEDDEVVMNITYDEVMYETNSDTITDNDEDEEFPFVDTPLEHLPIALKPKHSNKLPVPPKRILLDKKRYNLKDVSLQCECIVHHIKEMLVKYSYVDVCLYDYFYSRELNVYNYEIHLNINGTLGNDYEVKELSLGTFRYT